MVAGKRPRVKGGIRADIGCYVRSGWEANIFRWLAWMKKNKAIHDFSYEPMEFEFPVKRGGGKYYKPDFQVWTSPDEWYLIEVKGYMSPESKTKLKRMAKHHPGIRIDIIDQKHYNEIKKWAKIIPGWE